MFHLKSASRPAGAQAPTQAPATPRRRSRLARCAGALALPLGIAAFAVPLLTPKPAEAWWAGGVWVPGPVYAPRPYVYVAPPPVVYAPPPVYVPPTHWVPAHYNWRGFWIPGHWAP